MGKAIVTTDVGSVAQHIVDGVSGYIVPVRDVQALCKKVRLLVEQPALRQKIGAVARRTAVERLDIRHVAEKHRQIYRVVTDCRGNGE